MNNMYPGSDPEGDARESADLQIAERMPQPRRLEMPSMSEQETFLRLNALRSGWCIKGWVFFCILRRMTA
jgi:hypothetical protein